VGNPAGKVGGGRVGVKGVDSGTGDKQDFQGAEKKLHQKDTDENSLR